jgi:hypothetical protein
MPLVGAAIGAYLAQRDVRRADKAGIATWDRLAVWHRGEACDRAHDGWDIRVRAARVARLQAMTATEQVAIGRTAPCSITV